MKARSTFSDRRVVAIALPDLPCELSESRQTPPVESSEPRAQVRKHPFGVVLVPAPESVKSTERVSRGALTLSAVSSTARRYGVRAGQTTAEAHALVAGLEVRELSECRVTERLGQIAEMALGFGTTVAIEAPDTVWVDITGAAHLVGGEGPLSHLLVERVQSMGHTARVAVSDGPLLSRAFARWGSFTTAEGTLVVPSEQTKALIGDLPVLALPIDSEHSSWLVRLGVRTVADLERLPRASAASRLGDLASVVLDLAEGRDETPLIAYEPEQIPSEETTWDDPVDGSEPLLFVLRGLISRLSARLEGRGEAARVIQLVIQHDASIAAFRGVPPTTSVKLELSAPLWRSGELWRVLSSKLQRMRISAPSLGLRLEAPIVHRALRLQLDLSRGASGLGSNLAKGPETLPVLLAELAADLDGDRFGILKLENTHRPEGRSRLVQLAPLEILKRSSQSQSSLLDSGDAPTRSLPRPVPFNAKLRLGSTVAIDHRLYSIDRIDFEQRLDSVEWWTKRSIARDYLRVWLKGHEGSGGLEAIVYVNRETGTRFLQAVCD